MSAEYARSDCSEDRLCEDDDETACKAKKTLRSLRRIVALEAHTDLNEAPTGKNDANRSDNAKDDVRHVLNRSLSITVCQYGNHNDSDDSASDRSSEITLQDGLSLVLGKSSYFLV